MNYSSFRLRVWLALALVLSTATIGRAAILDGGGNPDPTWNSNSMLLWLSADAGVTLDAGNSVKGWSDQSTNAYQFQQLTAEYQPEYAAGALDSRSVLLFDGNDYMTLAGGPSGQQTAFFVYRDTSTANWVTPVGTVYDGKGSYHGHSNDSQLFNTTYTDAKTINGTNYRNGVNIGNGLSTGRPDNWALDVHVATGQLGQVVSTIGADNASPASRAINGGIAEVILYDDALNATELYQVGTYLENKYTPSYKTAVATKATGYWRLGESSGPAVNSASATYGSLDGTYNGFATGERDVPGITKFDGDGAASFNGTAANVSGNGLNSVAGGNPFARGAGNSWTIEAWFVRDAVTNDWQAVFSNNTAGPYKAPLLGFFDNPRDRNTLGLNPAGASPNVVVGTTLSDYIGKPVYAALTDTMSDLGGGDLLHTFNLYVNVDGTWLPTATGSWNEVTSGYGRMGAYDGFLIGQHYSGGGYRFDGTIDEVAIYNTALDQATIYRHFQLGIVPEPGSLVMLAGASLAFVVCGMRRMRRRAGVRAAAKIA